jgi:hypothetical protein
MLRPWKTMMQQHLAANGMPPFWINISQKATLLDLM